MTVETTFQHMWQRLQELQEALQALETTVDQDRPGRSDMIVASRMNDAVLAARGHVQDSLEAAREACAAVASPFDPNRAQRALVRCQERFHRFADCFGGELASWDRIDDLRSVGRERGQHWLDWTTVVTDGLEHCRCLLQEARNAVFLSWQDLTERMTALPLAVQAETTNVHRLTIEPARRMA
jgi:hypothetical protein